MRAVFNNVSSNALENQTSARIHKAFGAPNGRNIAVWSSFGAFKWVRWYSQKFQTDSKSNEIPNFVRQARSYPNKTPNRLEFRNYFFLARILNVFEDFRSTSLCKRMMSVENYS